MAAFSFVFLTGCFLTIPEHRDISLHYHGPKQLLQHLRGHHTQSKSLTAHHSHWAHPSIPFSMAIMRKIYQQTSPEQAITPPPSATCPASTGPGNNQAALLKPFSAIFPLKNLLQMDPLPCFILFGNTREGIDNNKNDFLEEFSFKSAHYLLLPHFSA